MFSTNATEAKSKFSELIGMVAYGRERVIINRKGKPVAALINIEELRRFEEMEEDLDAQLFKEAMAMKGKTIPLAEVVRRYEEHHKIKLVPAKKK